MTTTDTASNPHAGTGAGDACAAGGGLLSVDDARRRIQDLVRTVSGREQVHLRAALGRVLAEDVVSDHDVPPCDNSAMDGYALRAADLARDADTDLTVIGTAMAGQPFSGSVAAGQCVRIMTGAMLPQGADVVVMQERAHRDGARVRIGPGHAAGTNVRRAGEDIARGDTVIAAGTRLLPAHLGVIASLGVAEVAVRRRLRVAAFSTGDELRSLGEPLGPGDIYDSNRYTLHGMLSRLGVEVMDLGVIPDDREAVRWAFDQAAATADVVITTGGVSVGEADFVKETLDTLGHVDFWRIAMKPGKPLAFGRVGQAVFFGLPGNPVSVMATFYQFAQPALRRMQGETRVEPVTLSVPAATALRKQPGRTEFQRGVLGRDEHGRLVVSSTGAQGSHVLTSMSEADCFIILPAECAGVAPGEPVEVQPFEGLT